MKITPLHITISGASSGFGCRTTMWIMLVPGKRVYDTWFRYVKD